MNRKTILAAGLIGLAFASQPAFAKSVTVSYRGLDLATTEGQQALDSRIRAAAREVCEISPVQRQTLEESISARSCYDAALSSARKAVVDVMPAHRPA